MVTMATMRGWAGGGGEGRGGGGAWLSFGLVGRVGAYVGGWACMGWVGGWVTTAVFFVCKPLLVHSMHAKALDGHPQDGKVSCKTKPVSCFFLQAGSGPTGRCKKEAILRLPPLARG